VPLAPSTSLPIARLAPGTSGSGGRDNWHRDTDKFDWGGIIGAIIGAMIVVAVASFLIKRFAKRGVAG